MDFQKMLITLGPGSNVGHTSYICNAIKLNTSSAHIQRAYLQRDNGVYNQATQHFASFSKSIFSFRSTWSPTPTTSLNPPHQDIDDRPFLTPGLAEISPWMRSPTTFRDGVTTCRICSGAWVTTRVHGICTFSTLVWTPTRGAISCLLATRYADFSTFIERVLMPETLTGACDDTTYGRWSWPRDRGRVPARETAHRPTNESQEHLGSCYPLHRRPSQCSFLLRRSCRCTTRSVDHELTGC